MKAKKLFAGILAAAMILGSAVSGFAAPSGGTAPVPVPPTPTTPIVVPVPVPGYYYVPVRPAAPARPSTSTSTTTTATTAKTLYITESKIAETAAYKTLKETKPEITDIIDQVNAGSTDLATVAASFTDPELVAKLAGKEFVSPFFDLRWNDGVTQAEKDTLKNAEGKYVVSLKIPALTPTLTGVQLLHYSMDRGVWEVEDTTAIDLNAKTLSVGFKDFSPVAVIADANSLGE